MNIYLVLGYNYNTYSVEILGIYKTKNLAQDAAPLKGNSWDGFKFDSIRIEERWMVVE